MSHKYGFNSPCLVNISYVNLDLELKMEMFSVPLVSYKLAFYNFRIETDIEEL